MQGWISLHREILNNPIVCKDTDYFTVWVFLLLEATHTNQPKIFKGNKIVLKRGQLITGRKSIASRFNISESKVQRILKMFENEQQIEQQTSNKNRLVTVVNYNDYQNNEQQIEQSVNNKRTTNEQPVNTNNKDNKLNKDNKVIKDTLPPYQQIIDFLNEKAEKKFRNVESHKKFIKARWNDGFTFEEFKKVILIKTAEWFNTESDMYLQPSTLFGNKFDNYLNQKDIKTKTGKHNLPKDIESDWLDDYIKNIDKKTNRYDNVEMKFE